MEFISTTVGQLKQAIKATLLAVNGKTCELHIADAKLHVKANSHSGYCRINLDARGKFDGTASASIGVHAANVIFGTVSPDTEVKITPIEDGLRLRYGGSSLKLKKATADHVDNNLFAIANSCEGRVFVSKCKGKDLVAAFETPQSFAANNDVRQFLCGVYVEEVEGRLRLTATNGFMLNSVDTEIACEAKGFNAILPTAAAQAIDQVFKDEDEVEMFQVGEEASKKVVWKTDRLCWINYLIAGEYPNYKVLLTHEPVNDAEANLVIPRKDMVNAIARIMALNDNKFIFLEHKHGKLKIQSEDKEQVEMLDVQGPTAVLYPETDPATWQASFNGAMLSEIADQTPSASILFRKGPLASDKLFVRIVADEGVDAQWVAMLQPANL